VREELARDDGLRGSFTGTFERIGVKTSFGYTKKTVLLKDIKDSRGTLVADHLWFNLTKGFEALGLQPGDSVRFDARVKEYIKGYRGRRDDVFGKPIEVDYKLSHPTRIGKVKP
jgi:hypothetical protein